MSGAARTVTEADVRALLPPRPRDSHKGMFGKALLCVGSGQYTGAALLAAAAALRAGCGVLTVAVPGGVKPAFSALPEACCTAVNTGDVWDAAANEGALALLPGKRAVGVGCGMGDTEDERLLLGAIDSGLPLVIDADGLNLLARRPALLCRLHPNVILTPHMGEMARLLSTETAMVAASQMQTAAEAAETWNCVVLLKGAKSCIAAPDSLAWNETGNPGLSKGGSGDVLTGLVTGLLSQGLRPFDAACAGAYLLGVSADAALSILGNRMLMATDVVGAVRATVGQLSE